MKYIITFLFLFVATLMLAQDKKEANIQELTEAKNFVFKAESVTPPRGRYRHLTSDYDLVVKPDTVISFLPYYGRTHSAPIDPSEGGIKFTSSDFDYTLKKGKKQSWEITIRPKDVQDIQELFLTVFDNGKSTLRVNSINRESITFDGYVKEGKAVNKEF